MKKKNSNNKKLVSAAGMFLLSAAMLGSATYAWFTMNKEVTVSGMEVKAHAEEGLLINEVSDAGSPTWDEAATAGQSTAIALRSDLSVWWHANSKRSYDEAGIDDLSGTVDVDTSGNKYTNISVGNVSDNAYVAAGQGNVKAETHVYYKDASFGSGSQYDDGEGYYVMYKYYLKSSGDSTLNVTDLQAQVKAEKVANSGSSDNLDPALRVGVKYGSTGMKIFAPIPGTSSGSGATNDSYSVTQDVSGSPTTSVSPVVASAKGSFTEYTKINSSAETIPSVNTAGSPVYVYVWFEGEDTHCMSDNLTTALAAYDITINFKDNDLTNY